jgi:hypothetical protein
MAKAVFEIEMLPARHGDCLWVEYGRGRTRSRVLIDGGPVDTYEALAKRIGKMPRGQKSFELVVLTHVDADHVEGLVRLFAEAPLPFAVREVWFNGWRQMKAAHGMLGATQGEFLSALLVERVPRAWRAAARPWVVPAKGRLPVTKLPGGMELTLLSPSPKKLDSMAKAWSKAVKKAGFKPGDLRAAWKALAKRKELLPKRGLLGAAPDLDRLVKAQFVRDPAPPNGSSIAFLAEFEGKSALFLADAHPDVVVASLRRLCAERGVEKIAVDAVKVAHHGSQKNTNDELVQLIDSPRWLISTNGDKFKHPNKACIARILKHGKPRELCFNYASKFTKPWLTREAQHAHGYEARVRADDELSLRIPL